MFKCTGKKNDKNSLRLRLLCGRTEVRAISVTHYRSFLATLLKLGKQVDSTAHTETKPRNKYINLKCVLHHCFVLQHLCGHLPLFGQRSGEDFPFCWWISRMARLKGHLIYGCTEHIFRCVQADACRWLHCVVRGGVSQSLLLQPIARAIRGCGLRFSFFLLGQMPASPGVLRKSIQSIRCAVWFICFLPSLLFLLAHLPSLSLSLSPFSALSVYQLCIFSIIQSLTVPNHLTCSIYTICINSKIKIAFF